VIFEDFPGPGIFKNFPKNQDFPGGVGTLGAAAVKVYTVDVHLLLAGFLPRPLDPPPVPVFFLPGPALVTAGAT